MASRGNDERRSAERFAVELRVELKHLGRPQDTFADLTRDISAGGVFVDTSVALEPGTALELEIAAPAGQPPIRVGAVVVRVEAEPGRTGSKATAHMRGMGLRFEPGPEGQKDVERLLALAKEMQAAHAAGAKSKRR